MSVLELPRLHFAGTATTRLPTGPRCGLVDFAGHRVRTAAGPVPPDRPAAEFHDHLQRLGPHFDAAGRWTADGPFSLAKGWNFAGNGHFWLDARITAVETAEPAGPDAPATAAPPDPVLGRAVDVWGHYNPYLRTTVNRARVFDLDPASRSTMTLMVGRFAFGRLGRSHDHGYLASGEVRGLQPPRWVGFSRFRQPPDRALADQLGYSAVHQFAVAREEGLCWLPDRLGSPAVAELRRAATATDGLVVQFALDLMAAPPAPDAPNSWRVRGTIAPWHATELRSYPAGRLLVPRGAGGLGPLTVRLADGRATLNLVTAVPLTHHGTPPGPPTDFGDLELRTASGRLLARVPGPAYRAERTAGIVTVPADADGAERDEGLLLVGDGVDLVERQLHVQSDQAFLTLHHRDAARGRDHAARVPLRGYLRGEPAAGATVRPRPYPNPATGGPAELLTLPGRVRLDAHGTGVLELRGDRAGCGRVLLTAVHPTEDADDALDPTGFDDADPQARWAGAGALAVRVLPDDWHLDRIPDHEVDFALLHREVFAFYEQLSPFMTAEVFSLADRCKVATYAELIWQMCDPANRDRTYYMPPTRDLTDAKARLLLAYLRNQQAAARLPEPAPGPPATARPLRTRGELLTALRQAVTLELAVMLQYLYAAFSLPTHGAALRLVRQGQWSERQLALACGRGGATLDDGMRGALLAVAREEMIHFLLANNILTALGEPFHLPAIDFGTLNAELPVPLDFALEGLHIGSVSRFVAIEQPAGLVPALAGDPGGHGWGSISELYAAIRDGLQRLPDLFLVQRGRGGGEHHLFLRESVERVHPDYQLEVDDLASALVAVDLITEQGEGRGATGAAAEPSHFHTFCGISRTLADERVTGPHGLLLPWQPAYPVLRNPTLGDGDAAKDPVTTPTARAVLTLFNHCYGLALQLMAQHFAESPDASLRRSRLMNAAIDVMTGLLRPLAEVLVTLESGRAGRTAGPSFELPAPPRPVARPDVARRSFAARFARLARAAGEVAEVPTAVVELLAFYADFFDRAARA
ncbi:ferritin-like domain-containing protein [Kitasatospora sp. LaBMicrA B282]|uniref:ferritin-like domain-containing protein n=1 Tax=Kitasatospora sp. LaBMicrA B282 TaxID=3420949 RepID=UPI003D0F3701